MKQLFNPVLSAVLILIGALAILAFWVLTMSGQEISKWLFTLLAALLLVGVGIYSLVAWFRNRNQ